MCLTLDNSIHKKRFGKYRPIKTQRSIVVYKIGYINKHNPLIFDSAFNDFSYNLHTIYYTKFNIIDFRVFEGFHSYRNIPVMDYSEYYGRQGVVNCMATCIIPKGSKIFLSLDKEEFASNAIKIIELKQIKNN